MRKVTTQFPVSSNKNLPLLYRKKWWMILVVMMVLSGAAMLRAAGTTFTVNSTADTDDGACDALGSGVGNHDCTLREAINLSNAIPGTDRIEFNIPTTDAGFGNGVFTIHPTNYLPSIVDQVTIDGYSQPGASVNTQQNSDDAVLKIVVDTNGIPSNGNTTSLLTVAGGGGAPGSGSTLRGLALNGDTTFGLIELTGNGGHTIEGCFIGTNAAGSATPSQNQFGIKVFSPANVIGGSSPATRNLIDGNGEGIVIGFASNIVQGNFSGISASGITRLANNIGVRVGGGIFGGPTGSDFASQTLISGNVISGNSNPHTLGSGSSNSNIVIRASSDRTVVQGNVIGLRPDGNLLISAPGGPGIWVIGGTNIVIGGTATGAGNVISSNGDPGIVVTGGGSSLAPVLIQANVIGTDRSGTQARANNRGLYLESGTVTVGGSATGAGNLISGNTGNGLEVREGAIGTVAGNKIGTDATGTLDLGNTARGIEIGAGTSQNLLIGGTAPGAGNVISGNDSIGIWAHSFGGGITANIRIQGNFIGTDLNGTANLGNLSDGINLDGVSNTIIGGTAAGAGNVIAFNGGLGLYAYEGRPSLSVPIRRNSIHDNGNLGIYLSGGTRIPGVGARQNDPQDPDGDSNNGQNYPVLAAAGVSGSNLLVSGTLNSNPNTAFNLDFYANDVADPSGYGEGQTYVGSTSVTTDNNGDASFSNVSLTFPTGAGRFITATATDPANDTSEFSQALQAVSRGTLSFSTPTYSVNEGSGTATITVNRVGGADGAVSVDYTTSNGTATAGQDYTASNGTLSWADGDATPKTFTIPITEDTLSEANETVTLTLANATGGAIIGANNPATLTIVDNDPLPTLSINDVTQDEGNSGITNFTFTVNLSTASGQSVSVAYATADGTASAGSDYTSTNGTLTFNAGETSKTITVQVNGDTANEPNETFTVNLANPTNATLADNQGAGTITNDDFGAGTIQFSVANYSIAENGGTATITVTRTGDAATSVNYTTSNGTATAGSDYSAASGTLTWNNGDTAPKSFNVPIIDDALNEGDETVNLVLSNPTNGSTFGTPSTAVLTIVDNDSTAPPTPPTISINDISLTEGNSGTTPFNFVVSLSAPSSQTITVNYSTADGTVNPATAGSDYTPTSGILTFNPGETTKAIVVPVVGETAVEPNETFVVNLNNPTNATISRAQGTATILNDDSTTSNPQPGTLQYSSSNYSIGENGSSITVFVTRAGGSDGSVSVNYATSNGTAVAGSDYTAVSGTLTWANGDTSLKSFVIPITDDTLVESNETINLALSTPTGGSTLGTPNTAVLTIIDNDASTTPTTPTPTPISTDPNAPEISINNVLVTEGDTTPVNAIFTVRLSAPSTQRISVNYATQEGTAEENIDYEALAGTVTFNPGETRKNISIPVLGDAIDEPNETFFLVLSSPSQPLSIAHKAKATAIDSKSVTRSPRLGTRDVDFATCLIIDNDAPPTLSINDTRVTEGSAETVRATFTVNLSTVSARTVRVNYSTANGTTNPATSGADYEFTQGSLTFAPGEDTKTISVLVHDDNLDEDNETFFVNLGTPVNATLAHGQGVGTIVDNDDTPTVSIADASVAEGNTGTTNMTFNVTLSAASGRVVTVNYATANATATATNTTNPATAGTDYIATQGTLRFAPGETSKPIVVAVKGDTFDEGDETFLVNLSLPPGANVVLLHGQAVGTITSDDPSPRLSINDVSITEGNSGIKNAIFTVRLVNEAGQESTSIKNVTVHYQTEGATSNTFATPDVDYRSMSGDLTFAPGQTSKTITVPIIGDSTPEPDERFLVLLSRATGVFIKDAEGTGTIVNDDLRLGLASATYLVNEKPATSSDTLDNEVAINVQLEGAASAPVTVRYATQDNTAHAGSDYVAASGTLTFAPGETSKSFTIRALDDDLAESDETFNVILSNPSTGVVLGRQTAVVTIRDANSPRLTVSFARDVVSEGTGSGGSANPAASGVPFTVQRSGSTHDDLDVTLTLTADSANPSNNASPIGKIFKKSQRDNQAHFVEITPQPDGTFRIQIPRGRTTTSPDDLTGLYFVPTDDRLTNDVTGSHTVMLTASATSYLPGSDTVEVRDYDLNSPVLTVHLNERSIDEDRTAPITGTVKLSSSRPGSTLSTTAAVTVRLQAVVQGDPGQQKVTVPQTVTIPARSLQTTFHAHVVDNRVSDGDQVVAINASADNCQPDTAFLVVHDDEPPTLRVTIDHNTLSEAPGTNGANTATVTVESSQIPTPEDFGRDNSSNRFITASITISDTTQVEKVPNVPSSLRLVFSGNYPNSMSSTPTRYRGTFQLKAKNDSLIDGTQDVTITVHSQGYAPASIVVHVLDDDAPHLTLGVSPASFAENAGANAARGTVTRVASTTQPLQVALAVDDPGKAIVPGSVTIPAGATSASFDIGATDNDFVDGPLTTTITASSSGFASATATVKVTDNDTRRLTAQVEPAVFSEGAGAGAANVVVHRNFFGAVVSVTVTSSDTTEAVIAANNATRTFADNSLDLTIPVQAVDDALDDGTKTVTFTVTPNTNDISSATATAQVTDNDVPSLTLTINPLIIHEDAGANAATATLRRNYSGAPEIATLTSSDPNSATVPSSVTFSRTATSVTFPIAAVPDNVADGDKSVRIRARIARESTNPLKPVADLIGDQFITVVDDNAAKFSVTPSTSPTKLREGGTVLFYIGYTGNIVNPVSVHYLAGGGTATPGSDYPVTSGTLTFQPGGPRSQTVTMQIPVDNREEPDETFNMTLSDAVGAKITQGSVPVTIIDSDGPTPSFSPAEVTVDEGDSGTQDAVVTLRYRAPRPSHARFRTRRWRT